MDVLRDLWSSSLTLERNPFSALVLECLLLILILGVKVCCYFFFFVIRRQREKCLKTEVPNIKKCK